VKWCGEIQALVKYIQLSSEVGFMVWDWRMGAKENRGEGEKGVLEGSRKHQGGKVDDEKKSFGVKTR